MILFCFFFLLQEIYPIAVLAVITITLLGVLMASQFPIILSSETWSLVASLLVTGSVATATLLLAGRNALLPLFALLIAIHTMLPISRLVAIILATIVTVAHLAMSITYRLNSDFHSYYMQVQPIILVHSFLTLFWNNMGTCARGGGDRITNDERERALLLIHQCTIRTLTGKLIYIG